MSKEERIADLERDVEELRMEKEVLGFGPDDAVAEIDSLIEAKEMEIAFIEYGPQFRH